MPGASEQRVVLSEEQLDFSTDDTMHSDILNRSKYRAEANFDGLR